MSFFFADTAINKGKSNYWGYTFKFLWLLCGNECPQNGSVNSPLHTTLQTLSSTSIFTILVTNKTRGFAPCTSVLCRENHSTLIKYALEEISFSALQQLS